MLPSSSTPGALMTCKPPCPAGNSQLPGRSIRPDDWAAVLKDTKQFKTLGAALPKNETPGGDKEGYLKLANAYYQNAKATDEAADNKDKIKAAAAFAKLSNSCAACHKAHKPN